ncbi:MAG: phosphatidylglycerophosphatase A [Spirochaetes bacterium]|nr:phosphatidylglycerophosphatase A [Spirochaetota bacterium]
MTAFFVTLISTGLFVGYIPFTPGTFGSALGCVCWVLFSFTNPSLTPIAAAVCTGVGFLVSGYAERRVFKTRDDSRIVIDEISGMLVTFISFRFSLDVAGAVLLFAGFGLFRALDIAKPPPIGTLQKIDGAGGIMLDDIASGAIANGILQCIRLLFFG